MRETDLAASRADVIVALTSHNDVRTIGTVARGVQEGLAPYASTTAIRFVLADAGSTDGTREAAREVLGASTLVDVPHAATAEFHDIPYHGQPHRAAMLRAVLQTAQRLEARACAVIDASRQSLS